MWGCSQGREGGDEPPRNATSAMEYTRTRAMSNVCLMCLMDAILFLPCLMQRLMVWIHMLAFGCAMLMWLPGGLRNRLSAGLCHMWWHVSDFLSELFVKTFNITCSIIITPLSAK